MIASAAAWLPALIASIGIQLGTVVIYGSSGASQAGIYFIAFSIMTAISGLIYSLHSIAYPVLSGMTDGRKRFAWRVLKLSLIISLPLSSSFVVYAEDIMRLLGQQYVEGAQLLQILLLSMLPMAIVNAVTILAYAYGNYRHVLSIGLATNLPRVALYFFLVPIYGGQGAALSFSIGSIVGLIVTIFVARKIAIRLSWKDISVIFAVPMCLAFVQGYFNVNYGIGIFVTLLASYLLLMKFQVLTLQDAQDIAGVLPQQFSRPIVRALNIMNKKLNPS
jgi:O-antigen/teichoic acid export membrane protein